MEVEPNIPPARESEALLIAVDSYTNSTSPVAFQSLRDAAMRLARTRLIYSTLKDDLISVIKCGSDITSNKLAQENPGGYEGLEVLRAPSSKSLEAVRALANLTPGVSSSNLLNILDVCGDTLGEPAVARAKKKRLVLFTDGVDLCQSVQQEDTPDFESTCELYKSEEIQVDVVCYCPERTMDDLQALEDELADFEQPSVQELLDECRDFSLSFLYILCKVTGGALMSYSDASPLVDRPTPKVKRATAKYRGTLNIADILKIPVKRFSYVSEATHPTGKKVSWDATVKRKAVVGVSVDPQRVASTKDDSPLQDEEIVNAYPYGPELVPEPNEVDTYAWSMHLPKGLDVLGFVAQTSVPQKLFMGKVDVVIAMPGVHGAKRLMKSLVLGLNAEELGILARSVSAAQGGAPTLAFLWPRVEVDGETGALQNFFLFMVQVPLKEDIRDLPFATLEDEMNELPENADSAMDRYISSSMLEASDKEHETEDEENEEEDDEEDFWPPNICNPNLDWFNICIVHRALGGTSGTDFPAMSDWHRKLVTPSSFIREPNKASLDRALKDLKTALPVIPAKRREKRGKRVLQALNGDMASISDYLPDEALDADQNMQDEAEDYGEGDEEEDPLRNIDISDSMSVVTDFDITDVGHETPVADFRALVKQGKFSFAAASMLVVVRRLIRDLVDDDKAMSCLQALRKASLEQKNSRFFNDFIISSVARCNRKDSAGNRMAAFFRHVGRRGETESAIMIIPVTESKSGNSETRGDRAYRDFLDDVASQISQIVSQKEAALSTSAIDDGDSH